jgi:ribosomal protein S25
MADYGYTTADGETTAGWSGSEASHDRAVTEERSHRGKHRREQVLEVARLAGLDGVTWYEVATRLGIHHGAASGALSNLHKEGRLERLKERRGGSSIYVRPVAVNERPTSPHASTLRPKASSGDSAGSEELEALQRDLDAAHAAVETARQEGHDLGWQEGYDRGVTEAAPQNLVDEARRLGVAEGEVAILRAMGQHVEGLLMQVGAPNRQHPHTDRCWVTHPACTLLLVKRAVDGEAKKRGIKGGK